MTAVCQETPIVCLCETVLLIERNCGKKWVSSCYTKTVISSRIQSFYSLKYDNLIFYNMKVTLCVIGIYNYVFIYGSIETQKLKLVSKYFNEDRCFLEMFLSFLS